MPYPYNLLSLYNIIGITHLREDSWGPPGVKYFLGSDTSLKYSDISLIFSHVFVREKQGVTLVGKPTDQKEYFTAISLDI